MNTYLSKVHVGDLFGRSKNKFPLHHEVLTTSGFGFLQPIMCHELKAEESAHFSIDSRVLLGSMPTPVFGSMTWRTYFRFVPMEDLYMPYIAMMDGKPYTSHKASYVPQTVPQINWHDLSLMLLGFHTEVTFYTVANSIATAVSNQQQATAAFNSMKTAFPFKQLSGSEDAQNFRAVYYISNYASLKEVKIPSADYILTWQQSSTSYLAAFRFTTRTLNLRKVLYGCGFQLNLDHNELISFMPFAAYYKVWYDLFAIQQTSNWQQTVLYRQLDKMAEDGTNVISSPDYDSFLWSFLVDLSNCYYVQNPDFVSSHIATPSLSSSQNPPSINSRASLEMINPISSYPNGQPSFTEGSLTGQSITRNALLLLNRFAKTIQIERVIGNKLKSLASAFGFGDTDIIKDSNAIGSDKLSININELFARADTAAQGGSALGTMAGVGLGAGNGKKYHFSTKKTGYLVAIATIVPEGGFAQGLDPSLFHRSRYEFYNKQYDSLGYEVTRSSVICAMTNKNAGDNVSSSNFGYVPRYFNMKYKSNRMNGNINLRSSRDNFLSYSLDRFIQRTDIVAQPLPGSSTQFGLVDKIYTLPAASNDSWRVVGRDDSLANYSRVFNNMSDGYDVYFTQPQVDNFIVHCKVNLLVQSAMLPTSDSFDTDGDVKDGMDVNLS